LAGQKKIVVAGGGIAGLTAAHMLAQKGCHVTLLEKEMQVGGLARSFRYGDFVFDIGPHRFYSCSDGVNRFLEGLAGDCLSRILRYSAVYYCNSYHTWPLRLRSVFQMPLSVSIPAFFDLFTKSRHQGSREPNFRNFILAKYGNTLYETFFKAYTEKFLGLPPEKVHFHWAKIGVERATIDEKIKTGSISQLFALMLMPRPRQLNFLYPAGGCGQVSERLKKGIIAAGGQVLTGTVVSSIRHDSSRILELRAGDRRFENPDGVIWTAPITGLFDLMGFSQPGLQYLPLIIYNLEMSEPPLKNYQWCYFGGREQIFSRTTNPAQFDPANVPAGRGALCVEVTAPPGSGYWEDPGKLRDRVVQDLVKSGSIRDAGVVQDVHVERIADTYPVYDVDYLDKLAEVRRRLRPVQNLYLAGRTGLFWYNNMDHSIENAMGVAEKILSPAAGGLGDRALDPFPLGASVGDPTCALT
jgi:protoporphyrinogen oxidase